MLLVDSLLCWLVVVMLLVYTLLGWSVASSVFGCLIARLVAMLLVDSVISSVVG